MTFTERHQLVTTPRHWRGNMNGDFLYTSGVAGERFFTALRDDGAFTGSRCDSCDTTTIPPRIYCENCFSPTKVVDVEPEITVAHSTVLRLGVAGEALPSPQPRGLVTFAGVVGGLVHNLSEAYPAGTRVKPVFRPKGARTGEITDIICFEKA